MTSRNPAGDSTRPSAAKRLWRRYRLPAMALGVLVAGWFLLTQSPLTGAIVLSRLSQRLGAEVRAERVRVWLDGTITLDRLSATAPGVSGPAAAFAEAERVRAEVNWRELFIGNQPVRRLKLTRPVLRVSQSMTDGSLNLPRAGMPGVAVGPPELPVVEVDGGVLELGEHTPTGYRWLKRIAIDGEITPAPAPEGGGYAVRLEERRASDRAGAAKPFALEGRINKAGLTLILKGVDMQDWPPSAVPTPIRPRWEQLALEGRLSDIRFSHAYAADSPMVQATLDGVALNLPLPTEGVPQTGEAVTVPSGAFLRVHGTSGSLRLTPERIEAKLTGLIEDLPYRIELTWMGVEADAAFECELKSEGFELGKNPRVLRYAPQTIRERLGQFSNPTGIVDTRVVFRRGPPVDGVAAEVKLEGEIAFRDAVSSFADFPYEFRDMSGRVTFDADSITFHEVRGRAASGATVLARAHVAPLTDDAGVDVEVEVRGVPLLDPALKAGLGERAFLVDEIISREAFEGLLSRGVLRRPVDAGPAPVFEPGGTLDLSIYVRRLFGERSEWSELIVAEVRQPRLLPRRFPLPLVAENASLIIRDEQVDILSGVFTTPTGGVVELAGRLDLGAIARGGEFAPDLSLVAGGVPADGLFREAVASALEDGGVRAGGVDPASLVRALDTGGAISGRVDILMDGTGGEPVARGRIRADDLRLRPVTRAGPSTIELAGLAGAVEFGPGAITADVAGTVRSADRSAAPLASARLIASLDAERGAMAAGVTLDDLDAAAPLEDFAELLSGVVASRARELRERHRPSGTVDALLLLRVEADGATSGSVTLSDLRGLGFEAAGFRADLRSSAGAVTLASVGEGGGVARFDDLRAILSIDGEEAGTLRVRGTAPLGDATGSHVAWIRLEGARFESGLARRAAARAGEVFATQFQRFRPAGVFDLEIESAWNGGGLVEAPDVSARLIPRTLALEPGGERVEFQAVTGEVEFGVDGGRLSGLVLAAPLWTLSLDGPWQVWQLPDEPSRVSAALTLDVESTRDWSGSMPADLRATLPDELRELLAELSVDVGTALRARDVRLSLSEGPEGLGIAASGLVEARGLSLEAGVNVTEGAGAMEFMFERPAGRRPRFECWGRLETFRAAGVSMTTGRLRAVGSEDGAVFVPVFEADCHGGRVAGSAVVRAGPDGRRRYHADVRAADVRFDRLLDDLRVGSTRGEEPVERGRLEAHLSVTGRVGDERSRRGRGFAQVGGGRVVSMPLALSLVRVSNLQPPTDERLRLARANFQIEGSRVVFEELSLSSESVQIVGYGTMDWPGGALDLRFNSRSGKRLPILSGALEAIRDELITTEVVGTAMEPEVRLVSLPATRWIFRRLVGVEPSAQERRLERIRAEAAQHEDRLRRRRVAEPRSPDARASTP